MDSDEELGSGYEVSIRSNAVISKNELEKLMAVSLTLWGVRPDLELQPIVDIVVGFYERGAAWEELGTAVALMPPPQLHKGDQ